MLKTVEIFTQLTSAFTQNEIKHHPAYQTRIPGIVIHTYAT